MSPAGYAKALVVDAIRDFADDDTDDEGLLDEEEHENALMLALDLANAIEKLSVYDFVVLVRARGQVYHEPRSFA